MSSLHIENATVIHGNGETLREQTITIENGWVTKISGKKPMQLEPGQEAGQNTRQNTRQDAGQNTGENHQPHRAFRRIDAKGGICLPGLVNSHNHSPLMIVRGMVEDLGFAPAYTPGIPQGHWLSQEESYALSRLGVMEMMMAGATTIVDYYPNPDGLARSAFEMGVRGIVGGRIMDVDTSSLATGQYTYDSKIGEQTLGESMDLYNRWHGSDNGRISVILAPHAPDTCSRSLLKEVAELSRTLGCQLHTHLAQSKSEITQVMHREGYGSVALLDDIGVLDSHLVAAHCIFLSDAEIELLGARQVVVAHSPLGNARSGNIAPIVALEAAGATITLCTDSKSADMFESMRMAISSARIKAGGKFVLDAASVFAWATKNAADCFAPSGAARSLSVGEPADIIILDADAPNLSPYQDALGTVVHLASAANVRTVICSGNILVEDGKPTNVNAADVIAEAQSVADSLWRRAKQQ